MFSSWLTTVDPTAQNFHTAVPTDPSQLYGELTPKDTEWTIGSGIVTETQIWYNRLEDGSFLLVQIIHSSIGMWYPTVQLTCKLWNPATKEKTWKSINVGNFVTPPPVPAGGKPIDKRSCKSDQFSIIHSPAASSNGAYAESYSITANVSDDLQISLVVSRPAGIPGFKVGNGFSYFGVDPKNADGYVVHRFWPRTECTGHVIHAGRAIEAKGTGMFVHAIQGMRPNLVAASWNFADFQSEEKGGASAIMMEFKTIDQYGRKGTGSGGVLVNVGCVVIDGRLVSVSGETSWPDDPERGAEKAVQSRADHISPVLDPDTSYKAPTSVKYTWQAPAINFGEKGTVKAELVFDAGQPNAMKGLIEKVDVLAEIPKVLKTFVNYVAGTKPYIYQWFNPAVLKVTLPGSSTPREISGHLFNEATFIS